MEKDSKISKSMAIAMLWNQGVLTWKLDTVQKDLYAAYKTAKHKTLVWSCSRRSGKSYALCVIALEQCLQKPNSIVKFIAPSQKHVKMIIRPLLKKLLNDCPPELRPDFRTADNIYRFPNGSEIQLAGTDNGHAESLRGGDSHICIVDEAGFCDDLEYIVESILIPTTTTTRGKIILSSTPPKSFDHPFVDFMEEAELEGRFVKKTIYDCLGNRITMEIIKELIEEMGGEHTPAFKREYMCELIPDEEAVVVPEFTADRQKDIIKEWPTPPFRDLYVAADIGFRDLTVFLFAYYDFRAAKIVVEDEIVMNGAKMDTDVLAKSIIKKERDIWTNKVTGELLKPYLRVCDNNLILINDLQQLHKLTFFPVQKDDAEAALNNMRIFLKEGRIIINPKCVTLINHLKYAKWNKQRSSFARSKDHGHYDAVDALKYLVRSVQLGKNPYPQGFGMGSGERWFHGDKPPSDPKYDKFKSLFKPKPSIK
jgi:hypothetical protein